MERPMNAFPKPPAEEAYDLEDFRDNETLYKLLSRLPKNLRDEHMTRIGHLSTDKAEGYLYALHERRDAALRESGVSDEGLKPFFEAHKEEIWEALETRVFNGTENHVGAGTTARIKRLDFSEFGGEGSEAAPKVAVKFLVSPNEKTLSASGEHDMILEVEKFQAIERAEILANGADLRVRVPHPYFYYQKGKFQCYGMEEIDGINLEQGREGRYDAALGDDMRTSLKDIDRDALTVLHRAGLLHGDIKPRNLMMSREGILYVIDLGQSLLATHVNESSVESFENLKDAEKRNTKDAVRFFLTKLFAEEKIAA